MERRRAFFVAGAVTISALAGATALGASTGLLGFAGSGAAPAPAAADPPATETRIVHLPGHAVANGATSAGLAGSRSSSHGGGASTAAAPAPAPALRTDAPVAAGFESGPSDMTPPSSAVEAPEPPETEEPAEVEPPEAPEHEPIEAPETTEPAEPETGD